ncbi:MAG TPA: chemotaxis protein CheA [Solirubrobacteraceae bacterium]|nr:chemotaxis protein CheA [Solirubrobacteraceae bacterium]
MDPAEYLPLFVAESREHLQELNVSIVALERNPGDAAGVDAIFRVVHSVKGMAGTMGFAGMMRLTHEMEEVFELIRRRRGAVARATIDVVLECVDELSAAIDAIEEGGVEKIDPEPLIPRLRALVRAREPSDHLSAATSDSQGVPSSAPAPTPTSPTTFHVEFAATAGMPSVLAYVLLSELRDRDLLISSVPAADEVLDWHGSTVEVTCPEGCALAEVEAAAFAVEGVVSVTPAELENVEPLDEAAIETPGATSSNPGAEPSRATGIARSRTVRVDAERLDQLMHFMGELVVHRTQLTALVAQADVPGLARAMQDLERTSQALGAMVMKVRMIEIEAVFARLPRLVRDTAARLGKEVELIVIGAETELDRTVVDALGDPLVHLVRNAIDHGLEPSEQRVAAGKPPVGRLMVAARQAGRGVVITVRDDGSGVDPAKVAARARQRGLLGQDDQLTIEEAQDMLFKPGFSTSSEVGDISGRGVGLDAARDAVRALGGDIVIQSENGIGTLAEIRLPLTLAITSALVVEVAGLPFALPLDRVEWTLALADHSVQQAAGQTLLVLPEGVVPLCDAARALTGHEAEEPPEHAVIVRVGEDLLALAVGELIGQRELVTRPLPPELEVSRPVSAGALLAEGEIALIVDCDALADAAPGEVTARAIAA